MRKIFPKKYRVLKFLGRDGKDRAILKFPKKGRILTRSEADALIDFYESLLTHPHHMTYQ